MESLNKTQIVLLCLLASFVTSIGTGVITSTLLQEAPQTVTQTINRVVERTVETIVPQPTGTVTREVTVVVKEEDLIIDAIKKTRGSSVRIFENQSEGDPVLKSIGLIVKKDGTILADKRFIQNKGSYNVVFADGQSYPVKIAQISETSNAIFLIPTIPATAPRIFVPAVFGNSDNVQLGQTVIALGGKEKETVSIGRITLTDKADASGDGSSASTTSSVVSIQTDAPLRDLTPGSALLNLSGEVIGFENFDAENSIENMYGSINTIKRENLSFFEGGAGN